MLTRIDTANPSVRFIAFIPLIGTIVFYGKFCLPNFIFSYTAMNFYANYLPVYVVLALVGSISNSPGIPGIYLVQLLDTKSNAEVRVGYFGTYQSPS
jgi:hypothetical protein